MNIDVMTQDDMCMTLGGYQKQLSQSPYRSFRKTDCSLSISKHTQQTLEHVLLETADVPKIHRPRIT